MEQKKRRRGDRKDGYLVRDIERVFLDSDLLLPVKEDGSIDYDWMAKYTITGETKLKSILKRWIESKD